MHKQHVTLQVPCDLDLQNQLVLIINPCMVQQCFGEQLQTASFKYTFSIPKIFHPDQNEQETALCKKQANAASVLGDNSVK